MIIKTINKMVNSIRIMINKTMTKTTNTKIITMIITITPNTINRPNNSTTMSKIMIILKNNKRKYIILKFNIYLFYDVFIYRNGTS